MLGPDQAKRGKGGKVETKRQLNITPQMQLVVAHDSEQEGDEEGSEGEERLFETKKTKMKGRPGDSSTKRGVVTKTSKTSRNAKLI